MQFRAHAAARAAVLFSAPALLAGLTSAQSSQTFPLQPVAGAEVKLGESVLTSLSPLARRCRSASSGLTWSDASSASTWTGC